MAKFDKKQVSSSVLEDLEEMFQLAGELERRKKAPYTQKAKILKRIVEKLEPYMGRIAEPIYLSDTHDKYREKGVCLSGRFVNSGGEKLNDQELWLLYSGGFLAVKLTDHHYEGGVQWVDDEPKIGYGGYHWKAEAKKIEDLSEPLPTAEEVTWSIAYVALNWKEYGNSLLAPVKEVDEEHAELLLSLLKKIEAAYEGHAPSPLLHFLLNLTPESVRSLGRDCIQFLLSERAGTIFSKGLDDIIARFGKDATDLLIQVFTSSSGRNQRKRSFVVRALGKIGGEQAADHLVRVLQRDYSDSNFVRRGALEALGKIGDESAYVPMAKSWDSFYKEEVFKKAVESIRARLTETSVEPLIQLLEGGSSFERSLAAEGLEQIGSKRAVEALIHRCEDDPSPGARMETIPMLEKIGSNEALESLLRVYKKDKDREVQKRAGWALDRLGRRPKSLLEKVFGRR